jgi:hypothetical protein
MSEDFERAAWALECDVPAVRAVDAVESRGSGFLSDGRLRILFEGHQFYRYSNGVFAESHPTICHPKWTRENYAKGDAEARGRGEIERLELAKSLNVKAALMSASVGRFQLMGFNFALCGYTSVEAFWEDLIKSEREHLKAFCNYVKAVGLDAPLREHKWQEFARRYNGPDYQKNRYDEKLRKAWERFSRR